MTLRSKLLLGAGGIVLVSLILSAALSWVLVRNLEADTSFKQLDQLAGAARTEVVRQQCLDPAVICAELAPAGTYQDRLGRVAQGLGSDRLLLVDGFHVLLYDSSQNADAGQQLALVPVGPSRNVGSQRVREVRLQLGGESYLGSVAPLPTSRDPLGASFVILARPESSVTGAAVSQLLPRLLLAGGIALAFALVAALLVSRALARPLTELVRASDDIAHGNYSRRAAIAGSDEIGVLGQAFNRMAEAVERARTAQREFVANVSHELKTPLTSLIGFSQAMVDGSLRTEAEKRRAATVLHEESQRMLRLAQELLDLARVEAGQIPLDLQAVDLSSLIAQEIEVARVRAGERGLALDVELPPSLPPVRADPERVHQIFENLLDNALKYAPRGDKVRVAAFAENGIVRAQVSNAIGVHRPDPARMFERFYRGDPSRAADGGVGLGLAISRELAQVQDGSLSADVDGGDRLSLWLTLPAIRS